MQEIWRDWCVRIQRGSMYVYIEGEWCGRVVRGHLGKDGRVEALVAEWAMADVKKCGGV